MKHERETVVGNIKTRALKSSSEEWCSISIPKSIYLKLIDLSQKRQESISLIVRKHLMELVK